MTKTTKTIKTEMLCRAATDVAVDEENRTIELSFSSEDDNVERYYNGELGAEILDHTEGSVDLDWMRGGTAPFLLDHDHRRQIGVVESAEIRDRRGVAVVRFGNSAAAKEAFNDVKDKIKRNISVGYRVNRVRQEEGGDAKKTVFRVVDWQPYEISLVAVPADMSVGVGRSGEEIETLFETEKREKKMTTEPTVTPTEPTSPPVDVEKERSAAIKIERERADGIIKVAVQHNLRDFGEEHVGKGTSLAEFRGLLLDKIPEHKPLEATPANVDSDEKREYSLFNAIRANASGNWDNAGYEREISNTIAERLGEDPNGFFVPHNLNWDMRKPKDGQRDLVAGTDTAGGYLVGTDHRGDMFIDALRPKMAVVRAGARLMSGLVGDVEIPRLDTKTSSYWVGENVAPTEGAPVFGQVTMEPHTNAAFVNMSRRLLQQSDPSVEAVLRFDLLNQVANAWDIAAIQGASSGDDPTGILNTTGIGDVAIGTNGGAATWAKVVEVMTDVDDANAFEGSLNWIGSPKVRGHLLSTLKAASTDSVMIMQDPNNLIGYPYLSTTNSPDDLTKGTLSGAASSLLFGDFNSVILGQWGSLDIKSNPYSLDTQGAVRVTAFLDVDVAVRHAAAFSAIQDIDSTA